MIKKTAIILFTLLCFLMLSWQNIYAEDVPLGQSSEIQKKDEKKEKITGDIFGEEGGYFHPFLTVEAAYTTNIFFTDKNEESSVITTIAPGIWIALPRTREKLVSVSTSNSSPGGVEYSHLQADESRKLQTYFLYSPSFVFYSGFSDYNYTNHTLEGFFNYNFGFDVSLEIIDQYNIKSEINDDGQGKLLDEYQDNLFSVVASWEPSPKFKFRFDFSNYFTKFDKSVNGFRDRQDNSFAAYIFYRFKPKTSAFIEYEYAVIDYDSYSNSDSTEKRYYAGIDWEVSAKSKGRVKAGFLEKEFDLDSNRGEQGFSMEAQLQHAITPKSTFIINANRKYHETKLLDSYFIETTGISAAFLLRFSRKWSGAINASYRRETYTGSDQNGTIDERVDDIYGIGPAFKFDAKKWLVFEGGLHYTARDSNYDIYDYENGLIYLRMRIDL